MMQSFWLGHKENDKKIRWLSWEKMGLCKAQVVWAFETLSLLIRLF